MRMLVIRTPTSDCIDGIKLDRFVPGRQYEVGNVVGALFLAEGWAEPVASDEPAVLIPLSAFEPDRNDRPPNLVRDSGPRYDDTPHAVAADRPRKPRRS